MRRCIRIVPNQGKIIRTLPRPLIQPSLDIIRPPDLQPNRPRIGTRGFRREGVDILYGADGFAETARGGGGGGVILVLAVTITTTILSSVQER